jgi:sugar phosphate isomerase/epimerase
MVHSRLSVSAVSSWRASFEDDLAMWARLGIDHVGLSLRKCEAVGLDVAARRVRAAGLRISNVVECGWCRLDDPRTWPAHRDRLGAALAAFGAMTVVTTGPAGALEWDAAADAFCALVAPLDGTRLAVENTGALRIDLSFVTTLRDTIDLAQLAGTRMCVEINSCWAERDLARTLGRAGLALAHVQLSDWRIGSLSTPDRCVPGDGDIPLATILRHLDAAGYRGAFELELVGPQIEHEGYEAAITRALARADALLRESLADRGDEPPH